MSSSSSVETEADPSSQSLVPDSEYFRLHVLQADAHISLDSSSLDASSEAEPSSPAAAEENTSPSSSRKRPREEAPSDSDSNSLTPSDDSKSDSEDSASPSKRQKRRNEDDTPDSTPEPARPHEIQKKLRFHPDTDDNWLWADLYEGKLGQERKNYPSVWSSLPSARISCTQIAPALNEPSSSKTVDHNLGPSVPSPPAQPVLERPNVLKQIASRRRVSRKRATSFMAFQVWDIDSDFDSDTNSNTPGIEDDTSSIVTEFGDSPGHDCDDVSVPRSSPPPSAHIMAMNIPAAEANRLQCAMDAERKSKANIELPSIFERPPASLLGTREYRPLPRPMGEDPKGYIQGPPTPEEASHYLQTLMDTFDKLPGRSAAAAMKAFEMLSRHQADRYFKAGLRARQTKTTDTKKPE